VNPLRELLIGLKLFASPRSRKMMKAKPDLAETQKDR